MKTKGEMSGFDIRAISELNRRHHCNEAGAKNPIVIVHESGIQPGTPEV